MGTADGASGVAAGTAVGIDGAMFGAGASADGLLWSAAASAIGAALSGLPLDCSCTGADACGDLRIQTRQVAITRMVRTIRIGVHSPRSDCS